MNTKEELTKKQKDVLSFLKKFMAEKKFPPAVREICEGLGLSSPATVHAHLGKIEEKGYIKRLGQKNRALELLVDNEYDEKDKNIINVPLLGKVTAGSPIEAIEKPDEYFALPAYLVPAKKEVFTLTVSGDSMINAGIHDGDIIIVEKNNTARNGEMVVAMNNENEVTLKTFYKENGYFRLQPENDTMDPIILDKVTILGKAIGLYRKF